MNKKQPLRGVAFFVQFDEKISLDLRLLVWYNKSFGPADIGHIGWNFIFSSISRIFNKKFTFAGFVQISLNCPGQLRTLWPEFHINPSYGNFLLNPATSQLSLYSPETLYATKIFNPATLFPQQKNFQSFSSSSLFLPLKPSLPLFIFHLSGFFLCYRFVAQLPIFPALFCHHD